MEPFKRTDIITAGYLRKLARKTLNDHADKDETSQSIATCVAEVLGLVADRAETQGPLTEEAEV